MVLDESGLHVMNQYTTDIVMSDVSVPCYHFVTRASFQLAPGNIYYTTMLTIPKVYSHSVKQIPNEY